MLAGNELVILVLYAVFGGVGWLIGTSKGRPILGVVLGLLLGFIGWIVIAIVPRKTT